MNKKTWIIVLLLIGSILISSNAFSAWTQAKGHSYNQLTFSYYVTDHKFTTIENEPETNGEIGAITNPNGSNHRVPQAKFVSQKLTYYGEYGITDKLTIFTAIPYDWQTSDDTIKYAGERGPSGVGDINLGLRHSLVGNLFNTGMLMSIQGEVKIPEAYDYGYPLSHLSLGDGQYDATIAILFGKGFDWGYGWANIGYKFRFENDQYDPYSFDPSDQFKLSFGGGYPVTSWLALRGIVAWTKSVGNSSVSNELMRDYYINYGGINTYGDTVLIKDTLGLEADVLSAGIDLAFSINPKVQTVISYNRDLIGKDAGQGESISVAFVYIH
jgi:hypothetical protein